MLIVYDTTTGEVLDNTGTNSAMPQGPNEPLAYVNTDARGIARDSLALLRLHDEDAHDLVQAVLRNYAHVDPDTRALVIEGPYPTLTADTAAIPTDGTTAATVTYESGRAPATVSFDVNGQVTEEATVAGTAEVEVVSSSPGIITVTCEGLTVTITVQEV